MTEPVYLERGALFSNCEKYRYRLWRRWAEEGDVRRAGFWAVFVMLNPSTADAEKLDPTVRRCVSFAQRWGCGGLQVLNLFALRATDPKKLYSHHDPVGRDNDFHHDLVLRDCSPGPIVVAAWGAHGKLAMRGAIVARRLAGWKPQFLGLNADGTPKHPLYVKGDTKLLEYPL